MRRFLAIFGTLTVTTSSVGFLSNAFLASKTRINIKDETKDLTAANIATVAKASQSWNDAQIDETLKDSLQYQNQQLSINKKQLDMTKLPAEVVNHLDLALNHLNQAVNNGYIKVAITNNQVQLIYPNQVTSFASLNNNDDIVYFDNKPRLANFHSSYIWYSTYGPSHWWKFWEWGGYIHFSETAVRIANIVNIVTTIGNIVFLVENINEILEILNELQFLSHTNDIVRINELMAKFNRIVGSNALDILGGITAALAIFTVLVSFILGLSASASWATPIFAIIFTLLDTVTGQMLNADNGNGVKWKWPCFIIPGKISAE